MSSQDPLQARRQRQPQFHDAKYGGSDLHPRHCAAWQTQYVYSRMRDSLGDLLVRWFGGNAIRVCSPADPWRLHAHIRKCLLDGGPARPHSHHLDRDRAGSPLVGPHVVIYVARKRARAPTGPQFDRRTLIGCA